MSDAGASTGPGQPGFWGRATVAVGLAVYGWVMMAINLYLQHADIPEGPTRGLALFRRMVIGRGMVALGAASVLAALILALLAKRQPRARLAALVLGLAWIACLIWIWPSLFSRSPA